MKTNFSLPKMPCSLMTSQRIVASLPWTWKILLRPFADLRQRLDQIDHLMARLPFEADIVVRRLVEDQFPGIGIVGDVPVAGRPVAVHGAVFEGDLDALVGGALGKLAPDLLVARQAVGQRLVADAAGKAGNAGGAEVMGIVDAVLPALQRLRGRYRLSSSGLPNMPSVEMVMSRSPIASTQRLPSSARSWPLVVCQKKGSKLSKPMIGDLADALVGAALGGADHGADANGLWRGCSQSSILMLKFRRDWPVLALSIAPKTMARLLILSELTVSGRLPVSIASTKLAMTLAWPCVSVVTSRAREPRPAAKP